MTSRPIPERLYTILACPHDHAPLVKAHTGLLCAQCGNLYPVVEGVPILLRTDNELFRSEEMVSARSAPGAGLRTGIADWIEKAVPSISNNLVAEKNYRRLRDFVFERSESPVVLLIGGGEVGRGLDAILKDTRITFLETDVYLSDRVTVVTDGHDLPFKDGVFDAVICQAVLEHVLNPQRVVLEIYRVLGNSGIVYAETPFMQQVHMAGYDFSRFTLIGHRYLFRDFEHVSSGCTAGPAVAFAQSLRYFLRSFSAAAAWRAFVYVFTGFAMFWLKYLDYFLVTKPHSSDGASCTFFLGRKSNLRVGASEVLRMHWSDARQAPQGKSHVTRPGVPGTEVPIVRCVVKD